LILTTLHAGGKFGEGGYLYSGGLHGVGSSVVMALSRKLIAGIKRDGFEWRQAFGRGKVLSPLEKLGPTRGHGTSVYFEPDADIFRSTEFDGELIEERLEDMAYIHSGLKIVFKNEVTGADPKILAHARGIPEFLEHIVEKRGSPTVPLTPNDPATGQPG